MLAWMKKDADPGRVHGGRMAAIVANRTQRAILKLTCQFCGINPLTLEGGRQDRGGPSSERHPSRQLQPGFTVRVWGLGFRVWL
jgi:hypothetical protein